MAETGRSATAAASPSGDGSHRGGRCGAQGGRGRSKRPSASPRASPPPSKRGKVEAKAEASKPKEEAADAYVLGEPQQKYPQGSVVERSAALIRDIQGVFPPAPDATVLYGNQFLDLWACGQAMEEQWAETWRRLPLVLHDADLAEAVQINLPAEAEANAVAEADDLTKTISKVLIKHPGPIQCLRLDRTACPGADLLRSWVDTLSAKGVRELVLLNLTELRLEFPLHHLRSRNLTTLALGFFGLAALGSIDCCEHVAPSLRWLNLAGCSFSGRDLSAVVCRLPRLSSLTIGCCDVTAGCGRQGLTIDSRTLTRLHLWKCTASAVTIVDAPALHVLIAGVTSAPAAAVLIDLRSAQALQELHHLALHCHILRICSAATVRFRCRKVVSLPCLDTLDVGIHVCVPGQASVLVDLLGNLPRLQELILWRLDDLSARGDDDEACSKAWSLHVVPPCIRERLEHLAIREYRGGGGEVALVRRVMSAARSLLSVTLHPHHTVPLETAAAPFDGCPVASKECKLVVGRLLKKFAKGNLFCMEY